MDEYIAKCKIYRLFGKEYLRGEYEFIYNSTSNLFILKERFIFDNIKSKHSNEWNSYILFKISPVIVSNPAIKGNQCWKPDIDASDNIKNNGITLWKSRYSKQEHGYRYKLFALNDKNEYTTNCWKLETRYGNIKETGFTYSSLNDQKWDKHLFIERWDNSYRPNVCKIGTSFLIFVNSNTALLSYQCDDGITGGQMLLYLNKDARESRLCPWKIPMIRK